MSLNSLEILASLFTKSALDSPSSCKIKPSSSVFTSEPSSALNLNSSSSPSVLCNFLPWIFWISGSFIIVVIKHNFIFSSDISFEIIKTLFLCTNDKFATRLIVNLLLPELEGIATAIVSPFLNPLNSFVKRSNGNGIPVVKLFSPVSRNSVRPLFSTALLNFSVAVTCSTALSTSSTDIWSYNS